MIENIQKQQENAKPLLSVAPETIIIDIISEYRRTEQVFKNIEKETGSCVLCQGLFLPPGEAAHQFSFDPDGAIGNLNSVIDDDRR